MKEFQLNRKTKIRQKQNFGLRRIIWFALKGNLHFRVKPFSKTSKTNLEVVNLI
jgi:hypothetical protein